MRVRAIWRFVRFEAGLWRSLFLLVMRRRDGVGPGATAVGYHRASVPLWVLGLVATAVEAPVLHLLVPWRPVQLALLLLGLWGVLLVAGLWASYVVRPYVLDAAGIGLRHGPFRDLRLSWEQIAEIRPQTVRTWARTGMGTAVTVEGGRLGYVVHGETTVALTLTEPVNGVREVHVGADDPDALLAAFRVRAPLSPRR